MQSHIRKLYVCLAVTCHLCFWQNDRGLLHATAVTQGWTDTEIRVSAESWPWRRKFSRRAAPRDNTDNNNNEYLECLTRTGPKRLHILYRHIVQIQRSQHERTHTHTCTYACTRRLANPCKFQAVLFSFQRSPETWSNWGCVKDAVVSGPEGCVKVVVVQSQRNLICTAVYNTWSKCQTGAGCILNINYRKMACSVRVFACFMTCCLFAVLFERINSVSVGINR